MSAAEIAPAIPLLGLLALLALVSSSFVILVADRERREVGPNYWARGLCLLGFGLVVAVLGRLESGWLALESVLFLLAATCLVIAMYRLTCDNQVDYLTYGYALVGFSTLTAAIIIYAPRKVGYAFLVLELLLIIGAGCFRLYRKRAEIGLPYWPMIQLTLIGFLLGVSLHFSIAFLTPTLGDLGPTQKLLAELASTSLIATFIVLGTYNLLTVESRRAYVSLKTAQELDCVSGLMTRRNFVELASRVLATPQENTALLMIDIDRFKTINDSFGHLIGDSVIKTTAQAIRSSIRADDLASRYGGDEFCVLLRNCSRARAKEISDRILNAINTSRTSIPGLTWTVSIGYVATDNSLVSVPYATQPLQQLISSADKALYTAKDRGRNTAIQADSVEFV